MTIAPTPTYDEVLEFLLTSPSPEGIIAFRPSEATQQRIRELLEANRESRITAEGQRELDEFAQVEHFVRMLKIKARQKLGEK
jgi:Rad3-related DNA helicase